MSVIRPKPPQDPVRYDPRAADIDASDQGRDSFDAFRMRALAHPAGAEPKRLLDEYSRDRPASELFGLLAHARQVRDSVDRIVLVGDSPSIEAVRCLFETCCHPQHNELSRSERGGRPRLTTLEASVDNDSAAAALDLLISSGMARHDLVGRFALLVIADGEGEAPLAAASAAMRSRNDFLQGPQTVVDRHASGPADVESTWPLVACGTSMAIERFLRDVPAHAGNWSRLVLPPGLAEGIAPISAATLLPAAILGADVVRLLEGAVAAFTRLLEAPAEVNPLAWLDRIASLDGDPVARIEPLARWHAALRRVSGLSRNGRSARIDGGEPRRDRVLDAVGRPWPSRQQAKGASILMPRVDEHAVGQLLETLLAATVGGRPVQP
ncbi:MAG: hypothetical protein ACKOCN_02380 [Planctomycetaceae bacterium]